MIRPATKQDVQALSALFSATIGGHQSPQAIAGQIEAGSGLVLVSVRDDRPIGGIVGSVAGDEAEIHDVAVHPDHRRSGHGQRLISAFLTSSEAHGVRQVFLEVRRTNVAAGAMYAAASFVPVGEREGYYSDGETAVVLRWVRP